MAEGFLKSFDPDLEVYSAGTNPAEAVNPLAVKVMKEEGIDISGYYPKDVSKFLSDSFDYVITVCNNAKDSCPVFTGEVKTRLHIGFDDPAEATGTEDQVMGVFRRIRDQIKYEFRCFYEKLKFKQ